MAARKKPVDSLSLFGAPPSELTVERAATTEIARVAGRTASPAMGRQGNPSDVVDPAVTPGAQGGEIAERPKLRLAYVRPDEDVTIEPAEHGGFWVQRTRACGTTSATVHYTRGELEQLLRRIPAALEVG